jgi:hypothetical protein
VSIRDRCCPQYGGFDRTHVHTEWVLASALESMQAWEWVLELEWASAWE